MALVRYFLELNHHRWLSVYEGKSHPAIVVYTIGNPLIAQTIVKHDTRAALNIPLRLLIVEDPEGRKTRIMYHLPSSVMVLVDDPNIRGAARALDLKLENLLTMVARPDKSRLCESFCICHLYFLTDKTEGMSSSQIVVAPQNGISN
jgi:hypothetical protein